MARIERAPVRSEQGFTLIEVIITIALISIAFVGILTAISGMIMSGVQNKNASAVHAAVRNAAAFTQSFASAAYVPCSSTAPTPKQAYQTDLVGAAVPAGLTPTIDDVQFWNGDTPAHFTPGVCPPGGDQGLQLVTIKVSTSPNGLGGSFSKSLTVLKRSTP